MPFWISSCLSFVNLLIKSFWTIFDKLISLVPARNLLLFTSHVLIKYSICSKEGEAVFISPPEKEIFSVFSKRIIFELSRTFFLSSWFKTSLKTFLFSFIDNELSIISFSCPGYLKLFLKSPTPIPKANKIKNT